MSTSTDCHISVIYRIAFIYRALFLNLDCMIMYDNYGKLLLIFFMLGSLLARQKLGGKKKANNRHFLSKGNCFNTFRIFFNSSVVFYFNKTVAVD